jgi:hypothetical protein
LQQHAPAEDLSRLITILASYSSVDPQSFNISWLVSVECQVFQEAPEQWAA